MTRNSLRVRRQLKTLPADEIGLHPTKGIRKVSPKRGRAQMLVSLLRQGYSLSMRMQARFLKDGYLGQLGSV